MKHFVTGGLRRPIRIAACVLSAALLLACAAGEKGAPLAAGAVLVLRTSEAAAMQQPVPPATPAPTRLPAPTPSPAPTPFTLVWFPDTQSSAYAAPEALTAMGRWVVDHKESDDVVYVLQTGDLVDNGFVEKQWKNFELAYDQFAGRVPYFCIAGNHDLGVKRREWSGYLARPYAHTVPKAQEFAGGKAAYTLFSAGGTDFIVVGIGDSAERDAAAWARQTFNRYEERYGILMAHGYLHGNGTILEKNARYLYDRVVSKCKNVRITLNGHYRGTAYRAFAFDDDGDGVPDRTVHSFLCNYQHYMKVGGQIRLLRFRPADGSLTVDTFSAVNGNPVRDDTMKQPTFTLQNVF